MTDLKQTAECLFVDRDRYRSLSNEDKEYIFFITNRMMCRMFPRVASALNGKSVDKAAAMDVWYNLIARKSFRVPQAFWGRKKATADLLSIPKEKLKIVREIDSKHWALSLSDRDIDTLWRLAEDDVEYEIFMYKQSQKN